MLVVSRSYGSICLPWNTQVMHLVSKKVIYGWKGSIFNLFYLQFIWLEHKLKQRNKHQLREQLEKKIYFWLGCGGGGMCPGYLIFVFSENKIHFHGSTYSQMQLKAWSHTCFTSNWVSAYLLWAVTVKCQHESCIYVNQCLNFSGIY